MSRILAGILSATAAFVAAQPAAAGAFSLLGDQRWIVFASRADADDAIGVARYHQWQYPTIRVVRSTNGWFAIIAGPVRVSDVAGAKQKLIESGDVPRDLYFSVGNGFTGGVWEREPKPSRTIATFDARVPVTLRLGDVAVRLTKAPKPGSSEVMPVATGEQAGRPAFRMVLDESTRQPTEVGGTFSQVFATRLDPTTINAQYVFTSFWNGAHCCTVTRIATHDPSTGIWSVVKGETLDSDGYELVDLDRDGAEELVSGDNSFLYAFGSYAGSNAPTRIQQLRQARLVDVSRAPQFVSYQRQRLATMEYSAGLSPDRWRDNNFLAGWVAQSALVGRGEAAYSRAIELSDQTSDWTQECVVPGFALANCPKGQARTVPFPLALSRHLRENGYGDFGTLNVARLPPPPPTTVRPPDLQPSPSAPAPPATASPVPTTPPNGDGSSKTFSGTAFFVTKAGHALTNAHVVSGCSTITITTSAGTAAARLVAKDDTNDLALLRSESSAGPAATLRSSARLGETVAAFGYPLAGMLSTSGNFTLGNVTALSGLKDDSRYLQISAPVQPGNSGGPLVDASGNVVGVVTAKLNALKVMLAGDGDIPQNVNFAIKASAAQAFLETNGVPFEIGARGAAVETDILADRAKEISARVICRS